MLETDVPETINECVMAVKKMGRVGVISAYAGYTNGFNIGAVMEKVKISLDYKSILTQPSYSQGIRLIGNGQAPVHLYWKEILNDYIIPGKFDPTFMITHRVPIEDL